MIAIVGGGGFAGINGNGGIFGGGIGVSGSDGEGPGGGELPIAIGAGEGGQRCFRFGSKFDGEALTEDLSEMITKQMVQIMVIAHHVLEEFIGDSRERHLAMILEILSLELQMEQKYPILQ